MINRIKLRKIGMKKFIFIFCVAFFLSGCSKLAHLDQLLTLKAMGENKDQQRKFVKQQDQNFERILQACRENRLAQYPDSKSIAKAFGTPITVSEEVKDGVSRIKWLYRYSIKMLSADKVYLYFSSDGRLIEWQYVERPPAKTLPDTTPAAPAATPAAP